MTNATGTDSSNKFNELKNDALSESTSPISPVVEKKSSITLLIFKILGCVFGGLLIYYSFFSSDKKEDKKTSEVAATSASQNETSAPTLPLSTTQIAHLKQAFSNMQTQLPQITSQQEQAAKMLQLRMSAPIEVYSGDSSTDPAITNSSNSTNSNTANSVLGGGSANDANSKFMANVSSTTAPSVSATHIPHLSFTLAQGNIIQATLETRISSDLPGMVRAITSDDIYSEDDSTLLLPKGSKLIGQYTNNIAQGQSRVFVVWQRLIRPDGIDIELNSPGTDPLGGAGFEADDIDHHFWQQFGTAALLSIIGAGAANVGVSPTDQLNSSAEYRQAIATSFSQSAQQSMQSTGVISPTLSINQGSKVNVFVARDLDFYDELNTNNEDSNKSNF